MPVPVKRDYPRATRIQELNRPSCVGDHLVAAYENRMETSEDYLTRKHEELRLLNSCLREPLDLARPNTVAEVVKSKFRLTAVLRAEHALHDWSETETDWSERQHKTGPFVFHYDYQRADLEVDGPSFYGRVRGFIHDMAYTGSGMAAISALLLASARITGQADLLAWRGSYSETLELVEGYARHLRPILLQRSLDEVNWKGSSPRILLLDSSAPGEILAQTLCFDRPGIDLVIFDTTCFCADSGRIRRVLRWARAGGIPVVMVRSHTKLDFLGAEYGRLGSAAFVHATGKDPWPGSRFKNLPEEMRNAVRMLGGAALPAHFPPFVAKPAYRALTRKRAAAILRNNACARRVFRSALRGMPVETFANGLYFKLGSPQGLDEDAARRAASEMSADLGRAGLPIRHAGSFGFDFAAAEWSASARGGYSVRISVPDLPTALWNEVTHTIAKWWRVRLDRQAA
jgi:hypothetical protein